MRELIEHGLMYGGLKRVDEPHLVGRYNKALEALRLAPTALESFHIDATGYSPEIAHERGDEHYLDPRGINRLFILLGPEQHDMPIIRAEFSAEQIVLRRFMQANRMAIETLTLNDAMFGEMENLIYEVEKPADILAIRKVGFDLHSVEGTLEAARRLETTVARFEADPESWRDRALMQEIVDGARHCGDIRRNGIVPAELEFAWPDVTWTSHFGGCYVLRGAGRSFLFGDPARLTPLPAGVQAFALDDETAAIVALDQLDCLEPVNPWWLSSSGIVDHRIAMLVAWILGHAGVADPAAALDERQLPRLIYQHLDLLKQDTRFRVLSELRAALGNARGNRLPLAEGLLVRRALPEHPDVWDLNRLISEFVRFDLVTLFMVNKPRFYEVYATLPPSLRRFAITAIETIYHPSGAHVLRHKQAVRDRFFGTH
ncbi:hypothetical protein EDC22_105153 [Tepidamorphus gemmatus]|uniref:Uncharacterized protein n=1 Tax=Tepidamorphus gemmatus TaxID=747076 RepID=A0A4R3MAM8_9HYPH|nr:DUF6638 family protein [Tepidamorphus gemmatus]TCT10654.1 hypothetical protein EDC22_105153 [Tepidamorphus gemmatus]